jgi:hypothetical protein
MIKKRFKIKDLGKAKRLLGMEVVQSLNEVQLNQAQYIEDTILKYGFHKQIPLATPMKPNSQLTQATDEEIKQFKDLGMSY